MATGIAMHGTAWFDEDEGRVCAWCRRTITYALALWERDRYMLQVVTWWHEVCRNQRHFGQRA